MARIAVRVTVSGSVQGVSFRQLLKEHALRNDVDGWVRNRYDGSLEALLQGEDVNVNAVVEWARRGPPGARVTDFVREDLKEYPEKLGFEITG